MPDVETATQLNEDRESEGRITFPLSLPSLLVTKLVSVQNYAHLMVTAPCGVEMASFRALWVVAAQFPCSSRQSTSASA